MFNRLKNIIRFLRTPVDLNGRDGKQLTVSMLLGRDDCSRLLQKFADHDLSTCQNLLIVWEREAGEVLIETSEGLDTIRAAGLLAVAQNMVTAGGSDVKDNQ